VRCAIESVHDCSTNSLSLNRLTVYRVDSDGIAFSEEIEQAMRVKIQRITEFYFSFREDLFKLFFEMSKVTVLAMAENTDWRLVWFDVIELIYKDYLCLWLIMSMAGSRGPGEQMRLGQGDVATSLSDHFLSDCTMP